MRAGSRGSVRAVASLLGASGLIAAAAAQEATVADAAVREAPQDVVVTGSRLVRAGTDTLEPATVIGSDYIESRGLTNVADALNESPGFGTGTTPEGGQSSFGPGLNFVNRFGLGSNRTLTLVDGRRVVSSNAPALFGPANPGSQVDLNLIPTVALDAVENLAVGGAPTYGSDAIAGVVNVKLRRDFEGLRAFGQYGRVEHGGAPGDSVGLLGGFDFAEGRGNFTASVQRSTQNGLLATENARFARAYSYLINPSPGITATQPARRPDNDGRMNAEVPFNGGANDGVPASVLVRDRRLQVVNFGGVALPTGANNLGDGRLRCFGADSRTCLQFSENGELVPYRTGVNFGNNDASGGDGLYLIETLQLLSDLERTSAIASVRFDVDDDVRLFADVFAYTADALEIVDQTAYNSAHFPGASSGITLPADHPVLTPQARSTLAGLGVGSFRLSRAHRDLTVNNASSKTDLFQGVLGAKGGFGLGDRRYRWEAYVNAGRNESVYFSTQLNRQRFVNALNVVNVAGELRCSPTPGYLNLPAENAGRVLVGGEAPVADPGCVPLDIFGEGRPSAAAIDYVASVHGARSTIEQQVFNANIGSELFELRGGAIEYNVGFERRRETGEFAPDAFLAAGLGRSAASMPISGSYTTNEIFGEISVPVFSAKNNRPLLRELTLTAKGRRVDNTVNGAFTAYTGGIQWAPFGDIRLRGNVTRSMRAPALVELFMPVSQLFTQVSQDPCAAGVPASPTRQETRLANCQQFYQHYGLPTNGTWQSNAVTSSVPGTSRGNANLDNETANAWTAGFVLRPRWLDGVELAVDWVDIRVDDAITTLDANDTAIACFDNADYPNAYCDRITRNPAGSAQPGQITFVETGYINGAFQSMAGVMVEGRYRLTLGAAGELQIGASYFRLREELRSASGVTTTNTRDVLGSPTDSARVDVAWERGALGARWQAQHVGAQRYSRTLTPEQRDVLVVNADTIHNVSVSFKPAERAIARLAVTNLFDGEPPFPIGVDSFNGNYDFLGRRYSLSLSYDF